jgi:hypothetical protein
VIVLFPCCFQVFRDRFGVQFAPGNAEPTSSCVRHGYSGFPNPSTTRVGLHYPSHSKGVLPLELPEIPSVILGVEKEVD